MIIVSYNPEYGYRPRNRTLCKYGLFVIDWGNVRIEY